MQTGLSKGAYPKIGAYANFLMAQFMLRHGSKFKEL